MDNEGVNTKAEEKRASIELKQLYLTYEKTKQDFQTEINTLNKSKLYYQKILNKQKLSLSLSTKNNSDFLRLNSIGEIDKTTEINSIIKKLYIESEYKQAQETIAYKMIKKDILLNGDNECIVH